VFWTFSWLGNSHTSNIACHKVHAWGHWTKIWKVSSSSLPHIWHTRVVDICLLATITCVETGLHQILHASIFTFDGTGLLQITFHPGLAPSGRTWSTIILHLHGLVQAQSISTLDRKGSTLIRKPSNEILFISPWRLNLMDWWDACRREILL
jgi:hypothetical protein